MKVLAPMPVGVRPPNLFFSQALPPEQDFSVLIANVSNGFEAPGVSFSGPDDLIVNGHAFNVISARSGLLKETVLLADHLPLKDFFAGVTQTRTMEDAGKSMLVASNIFAHNYFHWTTQCMAAILLYRIAIKPSGGAIATAGLTPIMLEMLQLHGVEMDVMEIAPQQMAIITGGHCCNLLGDGFTHFPHPQIVRLLREPLGRIAPSRTFGRKLYITRKDSAKRRLMNEDAVEQRLLARGFEILQLSDLHLADQMAAFRDAEVIVAPHGAGLTNLIYCDVARAPARVIELAQGNYVNMCFIRIGQLLGLDYTFIVNPADPLTAVLANGNPDETTWHADLPLLDRVLDEQGL